MIGVPANPGCVVPSMVSGSLIAGNCEASVISCAPEPILKLMTSAPAFAFASSIACRNEPDPLSFVFVTTNVDAASAVGLKQSAYRLGNNAHPVARSTTSKAQMERGEVN